jgi:hypothetical protein
MAASGRLIPDAADFAVKAFSYHEPSTMNFLNKAA